MIRAVGIPHHRGTASVAGRVCRVLLSLATRTKDSISMYSLLLLWLRISLSLGLEGRVSCNLSATDVFRFPVVRRGYGLCAVQRVTRSVRCPGILFCR